MRVGVSEFVNGSFGQTGRQTKFRQTDYVVRTRINRGKIIQEGCQTNRKASRQVGSETNRQTDRQIDRQTDRQTDTKAAGIFV